MAIAAEFFTTQGVRQVTKSDVTALALLLCRIRDIALDDAAIIVAKYMDVEDTLSSLEDAKAGR